MNDAQKIEHLRKLLGTVVKNTKLEQTGKDGNAERERTQLGVVLHGMLGRQPSTEELTLAGTF